MRMIKILIVESYKKVETECTTTTSDIGKKQPRLERKDSVL